MYHQLLYLLVGIVVLWIFDVINRCIFLTFRRNLACLWIIAFYHWYCTPVFLLFMSAHACRERSITFYCDVLCFFAVVSFYLLHSTDIVNHGPSLNFLSEYNKPSIHLVMPFTIYLQENLFECLIDVLSHP